MESKSPRRYQEHRGGVNLLPSPRHSHSSNSSTSSSSSNGLHHTQFTPLTPSAPSPTSYPPKPLTRSESANPYPTTFVQADSSSFKQVVQMLTGSSETAKQASSASASKANSEAAARPHSHIPPMKKQSGFKLYERRNTLKNLNINPLLPVFSNTVSGFSPRNTEVLSPSILDFPALVLSPVTPLIPDPFHRSRSIDTQAEDKAIQEKGFFLHPSPASTPRDAEPPRLLPLFPTTSPGSSSS
ncbi:VQ motif-containing protein 4-like [Vigna unguiculata]|uniref:VQ domain-containing protein n=1 Tax=Vigna unguiculata TaxID=3917 RepID=A0A4D6L7I5_VIGUN|nr:VQ motif-containing protein 4-like [Vigna unguiculata]QCD84365.1 hypothetical protein DEO72_LG2g4717 [Vigna unguiculata]